MLELALAELELDFGKPARAAEKARALQPKLAAAGAAAASAQAWVIIARAHLAQQQLAEAKEALSHVDAATIQVFRIRAQHQLTAARVEIALRGDAANPDALEQIEAVRAEAETLGWTGLVLEARLARVAILWAIESEEAAEETRLLVEDATARGDGRIVRLAHPFSQR
jgi:hypothetical protein